ncbi:MAG: GNAT family N-acetyltransferase [Acidobacteriota bacterium]
MSIEVRRATPEDAVTIAEFALKLFAQHRDYDPDRFADLGDLEGARRFYGERCDADDAAILIAERDGRPLGYAYLEYEAVNYADLLESVAWLHDIFLERNARDIGGGKILMDAAIATAKELGAERMVLHTASQNATGKEFFERAGFRTSMYEMMLKLTD